MHGSDGGDADGDGDGDGDADWDWDADARSGTDDAAGADARVAAVRTYYRAIDEGAYDDLRSILAPGFVQDRSDRTFEGRDAFVRFMREDRPDTTTTHDLTGAYVAVGEAAEVVARGVVRRADGSAWFRFVDCFAFDDDGAIRTLVTFARDPGDGDEAAADGGA